MHEDVGDRIFRESKKDKINKILECKRSWVTTQKDLKLFFLLIPIEFIVVFFLNVHDQRSRENL